MNSVFVNYGASQFYATGTIREILENQAIFRQHAASIYGFVRASVCQSKKICVSIRWVTLWVRPPCVSVKLVTL